MIGRHRRDGEQDPWASERPLGSSPDRTIDAKLAAVVPLPVDSMEWLGTIQTYIAGGHSIRAAVMAANIAYPLR